MVPGLGTLFPYSFYGLCLLIRGKPWNLAGLLSLELVELFCRVWGGGGGGFVIGSFTGFLGWLVAVPKP